MIPGVISIGQYSVSELPDQFDLSVPDPLSTILASPLRSPVYLVIAYPYDPATEQIVPVYLSSKRYHTKPTDTLANQLFHPVLQSPYNIQVNMFTGGKLSPSVIPGFGDITLANPTTKYPNRTLDHLFNYSWRNRTIEIYLGEEGSAFSQFGRIFKGTAAGISGTLDTISIQLRDLQPKFDVPLQTNLYLGTGRDSLEFNFTLAANSYNYQDLTGVTDYVIQAGDRVEYEIYWLHPQAYIAFDYTCSDGSFWRGNGFDQNGLGNHPTTDLTAHAYGKWYKRFISVPGAHIGKTVSNFDIACENPLGTGVIKGALIRNIRFTDGSGNTRKLVWMSNDSYPTTATHLNLGTNSVTLHSRFEGTEAEANKPKPLAYGVVRNISPVLVHSQSLVYQVHDGSVFSVLAVKDRGVTLTNAGNVSNVDTWTPVASQYVTDNSRGLIKLGSAPAGTVTADVQGDNQGSYVATSANIIQRIVTQRGGLTYPDNFDAASFTGVNAANSAVIGYWSGLESVTIADVLNAIVAGIGGYWTFDRQSQLKIGILDLPGVPTVTLTNLDVAVDGIELLPYSSPVKRHRLGYKKNYTVQSPSDLAASLTVAERALLGIEYQYVTAEDSTVSIIHQDAPEEEVLTLFDNIADAQAEATRRQSILGKTPFRFKVPLSRGLFQYYIDTDINLKVDRWGLEDGMYFTIMSLIEEVETNNIVLELWGVGDPYKAGDKLLLDTTSTTDFLLLDIGSTSDVLLLE